MAMSQKNEVGSASNNWYGYTSLARDVAGKSNTHSKPERTK